MYNKSIQLLATLLLPFLLFISCDKKSNGDDNSNTMTGNDGKRYQIIQIGIQWWMAENLRETQYRDGSAIPNVTDNATWGTLLTGARCAYDNNETNAETYGYLYNMFALIDTRNIAPEGWHVPTDEEWKELEMAVGMSESQVSGTLSRGTDEAAKLAGNITLWESGALVNSAVFGESGFLALPGGWRYYNTGTFYDFGEETIFWSSTPGPWPAYGWWNREIMSCDTQVWRSNFSSSKYGFSVRLVRD